MQSNIENSGVSVKTLVAAVLMFINVAFGLIAFIYAQGQTVSQERVNKLEARVTELEKNAAAVQNTLTQNDGRINRNDERTQINGKSIDDLTTRVTNSEKILILSNARYK
jgi:peptidoglycan hydrolase CwlO-like protein